MSIFCKHRRTFTIDSLLNFEMSQIGSKYKVNWSFAVERYLDFLVHEINKKEKALEGMTSDEFHKEILFFSDKATENCKFSL